MGPIRESETVQDEEILPSPCGERTDNRLDLDRHKEEYVANGSQGHGNEHWEVDDEGYMRRRDVSINDYKIDESERKFRWER